MVTVYRETYCIVCPVSYIVPYRPESESLFLYYFFFLRLVFVTAREGDMVSILSNIGVKSVTPSPAIVFTVCCFIKLIHNTNAQCSFINTQY